jgi:cell wall assembly regulator SMI1
MNTDLQFLYPHPATTEEAIAALEKELGFRLSEDYRNFLLKYNGGGRPTRGDFDYIEPDGEENTSSVDIFLA